MMKPIGKGVLLSDNSSNKIIDEVISVLRKNDFDDAMISQFTDNAVKVLNDYAGLVGEGTEITYLISKRFAKVELKVMIPGEKYDPFKSGTEARTFTFRNRPQKHTQTFIVRMRRDDRDQVIDISNVLRGAVR